MILKFIFRFFIACFALLLFTIVAVACCFWLVNQEPAFYADLRNQQFTEAEQNAVKDRLRLLAESMGQWAMSSVQRQKLPLEFQHAEQEHGKKPFDPAANTKDFIISQYDLNATLASNKYSSGDFRNLRAQILDDRIRFAGELYVTAETPIVLSVDFRLSRILNNQLKLEIIGGSLGRLPLPLQWLLRCLPADVFRSQRELEVRFSDTVPHVLMDITDSSRSRPVLKQIRTIAGKITLELGALSRCRLKVFNFTVADC